MAEVYGEKFHYEDHDTDVVDESPPIQNTWYEVFHAYDVRLIWCVMVQGNDEVAAKDVELRWTIDGNVYFSADSIADSSWEYAYRDALPSAVGTAGLTVGATSVNAGKYVDKRGKDFKVEVRMTGVPGTNQRLRCYCVRETLELT